jgi:hypothetical protein
MNGNTSTHATPAVLIRRLTELGYDCGATQAAIADTIVSYVLRDAVCARINGRIATFGQYFVACFGVNLDGSAVREKRRAAK